MPKARHPVPIGPITKGFAARLRAEREQRSWTQTALAEKSGINRSRVVYLEQADDLPRLHEVERFAEVFGIEVFQLLSGKPTAVTRQGDELDQLAHHLTAAVQVLVKFLRGLDEPDEADQKQEGRTANWASKLEPERPITQRAPPAAASSWPTIIKAASAFLVEDPRRVWKANELCDALKAQGIRPKQTRGFHMAILPRLREAGLVTEKKDGTLTAKLSKPSKAQGTPRKTQKKPRASTIAKAQGKYAAIDDLVDAARTILNAEPERAWKPIDFVRAIREASVERDSWRGVHFYLPKILKDAGLIEMTGRGTFVGAQPRNQSAKSEEREAQPADRPDDHTSAISSLAHEIDAISSRLTGMTPRERVAQLAVWAGRARQIDEDLAAKKIPSNSGLRNQVKQIIARSKKLRKSLGCGWVDALSSSWSADWNIYISFNRSVVASEPSNLTAEQKKQYFRDILRSILTVRRSFARDLDAAALVIEASQALDKDDPLLIEARKKFGHHEDRRENTAQPEAPYRRQDDAPHRVAAENKDARREGIPRNVLKMTRGRSMLIAGGRGSHETQRLALKKGFQLKAVDWITGERHPDPARLFSMAIRNKRYDIVLLMPGTDDAEPLVMACKEAGSRLSYLTRAPSIPSVAEAIDAEVG